MKRIPSKDRHRLDAEPVCGFDAPSAGMLQSLGNQDVLEVLEPVIEDRQP